MKKFQEYKNTENSMCGYRWTGKDSKRGGKSLLMIRSRQASCYPTVLSVCKNVCVWMNLEQWGSLNILENLMKAMVSSLRKMLIHIKFSLQFQEFRLVLKHRQRGLCIEVTSWQEKLSAVMALYKLRQKKKIKM